MDLLYRFGGLKNKEIGILMGVDYSTVSQGRKRFTEKRNSNKDLDTLVKNLEGDLSRIKICPYLPILLALILAGFKNQKVRT